MDANKAGANSTYNHIWILHIPSMSSLILSWLHSLLKAYPMIKLNNHPVTSINAEQPPTGPLILIGAVSDMYLGQITVSTPVASPDMNLPTHNEIWFSSVTMVMMHPTMLRIFAMMIIRQRPNLAKFPTQSEPRAHPMTQYTWIILFTSVISAAVLVDSQS